jgi:peptidoglycan/xylan/chitin deacetylase (PgdA/CDA1 family)
MRSNLLPNSKLLISVLAASLFILATTQGPGATTRTNRSGVEKTGKTLTRDHGGIIRGPLLEKKIAFIFTGGDFGDGGEHIRKVLAQRKIKASFFFTGDFYRNPNFRGIVQGLIADGHYLGPHSDKHLLYCPWEDREKTLVTQKEFRDDLKANYAVMKKFGISKNRALYFIPPYEWYNNDISTWAKEMGVQVFDFTPGTLSNADYTTPDMKNYKSSDTIFKSVLDYEKKDPHGLNGFLLLIHIGADPKRTDKFYLRLNDLIGELSEKGYSFERVDELLAP